MYHIDPFVINHCNFVTDYPSIYTSTAGQRFTITCCFNIPHVSLFLFVFHLVRTQYPALNNLHATFFRLSGSFSN